MNTIILHSHELAALSDGRLSQVRRPVEPQPPCKIARDADGCYTPVGMPWGGADWCCPFGAPSDRLRVLETWRPVMEAYYSFVEYPSGPPLKNVNRDHFLGLDKAALRFNGARKDIRSEEWHSPESMPEWASRYFLEVEDVRVGRLIEMPLDEMESVAPVERLKAESSVGLLESTAMISWYAGVWDKLYPDHPWNSNPWTWVVDVKEASR